MFRFLIEGEPDFGEGLDAWRAWRAKLGKFPAEDEGVIAAKLTADEMIADLEKTEAAAT